MPRWGISAIGLLWLLACGSGRKPEKPKPAEKPARAPAPAAEPVKADPLAELDRSFDLRFQLQLGHREAVADLAVSPDGALVASIDRVGAVKLWRAESGALLRSFPPLQDRGTSAAIGFASADQLVLTLGLSDQLWRYDIDDGERRSQKLAGGFGAVLATAAGRQRVAYADGDELVVQDAGGAVNRQKVGIYAKQIALDGAGAVAYLVAKDGAVSQWEIDGKRERRGWKADVGQVSAVALSADGTALALVGDAQRAQVFDTATGTLRQTLTASGGLDRVRAPIALSADGSRAVTAISYDGRMAVWNLASGAAERHLSGHDKSAAAVSFAADGLLVSGSDDRSVRIWEIATGATRRVMPGLTRDVEAAAAQQGGDRVLVAMNDGAGHLLQWDVANARQRWSRTDPEMESWRLAVSGDGKHLLGTALVGMSRYSLRRWSGDDGTPRIPFAGHDDYPHRLATLADGRTALSVSYTGELMRWDLETRAFTQRLKVDSQLAALAVAPGDGMAAVGGCARRSEDDDRCLRPTLVLWQLAGDGSKRTLAATDEAHAIAWLPDGKQLIAVGGKTAQIWHLTGKPSVRAVPIDFVATAVAVRPDGQRFAVAGCARWDRGDCAEPVISERELASGRELAADRGGGASASALVYSADGNQLVVGDSRDSIWAWSPATGKRSPATVMGARIVALKREAFGFAVATNKRWAVWNPADGSLRGDVSVKAHLGAVAFSSDGSRVVTTAGQRLALWNRRDGRMIEFLGATGAAPAEVAIGPAGRIGATANRDGSITLWDLRTGTATASWPAHAEAPRYLQFSPDGRQLITAVGDRAHIWSVTDRSKLGERNVSGNIVAIDAGADGALLTIDWDGAVALHDRAGAIQPLVAAAAPGTPRARIVRFLPGERVAVGYGDGRVELYRTDGKRLAGRALHDGAVVWIGTRGERVLSVGADHTLRMWDVGADAVLTMVGDGREWLVYTEDGYFDASPRGGELVAMVRGVDAFAMDQFALYKNRPDVIFRRFGLGTADAVAHYRAVALRRLRKAKRKQALPDAGAALPTAAISLAAQHGQMATVTVELADAGAGLASYQLFVNHVPLGAAPVAVTGERQRLTREIELGDGRNLVEVSARNRNGAESARAAVVVEWDAAAAGELQLRGHKSRVTSGAVLADGRLLTGGWDRTIRVWQRPRQQPVATWTGHKLPVLAVAVSPDSRTVASGSARTPTGPGEVLLWDSSSGRVRRRLKGHKWSVDVLAFSPDGSLLAAGGGERRGPIPARGTENTKMGAVTIWQVGSGKRVARIPTYAKVESLGFTADGRLLIGSGIWDRNQRKYSWHSLWGDPAALTAAGELAATSLSDGQIALRDARTGNELRKLGRARSEHVVAVGFNPSGSRLAAAFSDHEIEIFDTATGARLRVLAGHREAVLRLGFVDDQTLWSASADETARIWDLSRPPVDTRGDLYFIGLGVSKYRDPALDLAYAGKDANDLAGVMKKAASSYRAVHVKTFVDDQVGPAALKEASALLANAKVGDTAIVFVSGHGVHDRDPAATFYYLTSRTDLERLAATAISFEQIESLLAGIAPRRKLLLLDTCESGELDPAERRASSAEADRLEMRSRGVRVGASPSAPAAAATPVPRRRYLGQRDRYIYRDLFRRTGAVVFSSSAGGELSYESDEIENGFFTAAIVAALTGKAADTDGDGRVSGQELRTFVSARVSKQTMGLQNPTVDRDNIYQRFSLPVVR